MLNKNDEYTDSQLHAICCFGEEGRMEIWTHPYVWLSLECYITAKTMSSVSCITRSCCNVLSLSSSKSLYVCLYLEVFSIVVLDVLWRIILITHRSIFCMSSKYVRTLIIWFASSGTQCSSAKGKYGCFFQVHAKLASIRYWYVSVLVVVTIYFT